VVKDIASLLIFESMLYVCLFYKNYSIIKKFERVKYMINSKISKKKWRLAAELLFLMGFFIVPISIALVFQEEKENENIFLSKSPKDYGSITFLLRTRSLRQSGIFGL